MERLRCNAKVNLGLRVGRLRPDGFHGIESVFHSVTLSDTITIDDGSSAEIVLEVEGASGLEGPDNTMVRAALALQEHAGASRWAQLTLSKRIPIGAGLGGGSADAAAVLLGLNRLWGLDLPMDQLHVLAAEIGSDVPYCLTGGPMLVSGRGESLDPIPASRTLWIVLGISTEPLSTAAVYARWDELGLEPGVSVAPLVTALGAGDLAGVAEAMHNDLEHASFSLRPELRSLKDEMTAAGAVGALMTGSGPTMMGLCESQAHAHEVAATVDGAFDRVEVVSTSSSCVSSLGE